MRAALAATILCAAACGDADRPRPPVSTHVDDWRDRVVYQIVVDRFDNGDTTNDGAGGAVVVPGSLARHQGGDWRGVRDRLGYVEALGASAIWISPVVDNVVTTEREDGYHGYWASDFTRPNPRFGSLDELRALVDEAHERDILVIVDIVTNHAGRVFSYDLDGDGAIGEGEVEPPFSGDGPYDVPLVWHVEPPSLVGLTLGEPHFRRRGRGDTADPVERVLGDFPTGLRDIDTQSDAVLAAMVETYARWVEDTDVDGFRVDAVPHVELPFWPRFCGELRRRLAEMGKERFLIFGEIFASDPAHRASFTEDGGLDSTLDFAVKFQLVDAVILDGLPPAGAVGALADHRALFPDRGHELGVGLSPWEARLAFGDNHDTWRLRGEIDDPRVVRLALTVVFTLDAIPVVYYGTEQDLSGQGGPGSREVLWPTGFDTTGETFRFVARLAALRREHAALRRGSLEVRYASAEGGREGESADAGLLAWERVHDGERLLVVLNSHAFRSARARVPSGFEAGVSLRDRLGASDEAWLVRPGGAIEIELPVRTAVVLGP